MRGALVTLSLLLGVCAIYADQPENGCEEYAEAIRSYETALRAAEAEIEAMKMVESAMIDEILALRGEVMGVRNLVEGWRGMYESEVAFRKRVESRGRWAKFWTGGKWTLIGFGGGYILNEAIDD